MGNRLLCEGSWEDNGEAIRHLAETLQGQSLVLFSESAFEVGAWIAFEVRLRDKSVLLEGLGKCERCRRAGANHTVMLGELDLDATSQLVFERICLAKEDNDTGARTTGLTDLRTLGADSVSDDDEKTRFVGEDEEDNEPTRFMDEGPAKLPAPAQVPPTDEMTREWAVPEGELHGGVTVVAEPPPVRPPPLRPSTNMASIPPAPRKLTVPPRKSETLAPASRAAEPRPATIAPKPLSSAEAKAPSKSAERLLLERMVALGLVKNDSQLRELALAIGLQALKRAHGLEK